MPELPGALIVGGARMGIAVGQRLSRLGYRIYFSYRQSKDAALAAVSVIESSKGQAATVQCDVSSVDSIEALAKQFTADKKLSVLVNLASVYEETPAGNGAASWELNVDANARSAYVLTKVLGPLIAASDRGRIIHISDWTSASGRPRYAEYSAYYVSKSAVKAVVESMALELAPKVLVNGIAPGPMIPPPSMSADERSSVEKATPLGRWGGAEEIAKAVQFLVETEFTTGEVIRVDGGRHLF